MSQEKRNGKPHAQNSVALQRSVVLLRGLDEELKQMENRRKVVWQFAAARIDVAGNESTPDRRWMDGT